MLEAFRLWKGVSLETLGRKLGRSTAVVARYCLPATDDRHIHPPGAVGLPLREWSEGRVHLGNCTDLWTPAIQAEWESAPASAEAAP